MSNEPKSSTEATRWPRRLKARHETSRPSPHYLSGRAGAQILQRFVIQLSLERFRDKYLAASIKPHGPIGKPPRWNLWTYNQPGPANKGILTCRLLTRDLGRPIGLFGTVLDLRCCGRPEWSGNCTLPSRAVVSIYGHRRYKGPMLDALLKRRNCATYLAGMTRHINDGIECLSGKRREAIQCVAVYG